jgi:hypothetical protein
LKAEAEETVIGAAVPPPVGNRLAADKSDIGKNKGKKGETSG